MMRKKFYSILKYALFLGLGIFLIWWQISKMTELQKVQFEESLKSAHYIYLIPILIMAILSHLSRALRWKIMLEHMGYYPSTSNTFYATMTGYFANNFVPRAGEVMRCTMLAKYEKIPFAKAFGTVIVERLFDLVCYISIIIITFLIQIQTVSNFISEKLDAIAPKKFSISPWLIVAAIIVVIILLYFSFKWGYKKYGNLGIVQKINQITKGLNEGLLTIIRLKKRKAFLFYSLLIWTMYFFQIYIGFNALNITSGLGIGAALSVLSLSTLAMIISPGGIGAFPVAVQQVLLIYHVDNISFGWLIWGANTGIIILLGIISFLLLHFKNKNETDKQHSGEDLTRAGNSEASETMAVKK